MTFEEWAESTTEDLSDPRIKALAQMAFEAGQEECDFCFEGEQSDPESWSARQRLEFEVEDLRPMVERAGEARGQLAEMLGCPAIWKNIIEKLSFNLAQLKAYNEWAGE
jgi:hypothetical protein